MKEGSKKLKISKKIVVPVLALGIVAIATFSSATLALADDVDTNGETLAQRISNRFGLNQEEVETTMEEYRYEHRQMHEERMGEMLEERLSEAVEEGELTSDQMYAVLAKHEEMESERDELEDLSPEERREAMADHHEEMEAWAQENDIDLDIFHRYGEGGYGKPMRGMGMH